jgi:NitT/TauT family transport system substrate-binding protein
MVALSGCGATASLPSGPAASQEPVTLKAGTQHVATDAPLYIAQAKGYFKEQGLDVQFTDINGEEAISAVGTGQLDVSVGAIFSGLLNAIARGVEIRLVATKGSISTRVDVDKPASGLVIAKKLADSGAIKEWKDLRGRNVAVTALGATQEESLDMGLRKGGLTIGDVNVKTMPFPDTLPALANGSIDAAMELQPWITQGKAKGILAVFKDSAEMTPGLQTNALTFGPSIPKLGQNAGNRFMTAYTQGLRYYNDAVTKHLNWDEFVAIMVKNTSLKEQTLYDQVGWTYMNPDCSVNAPSIVDNLTWYTEHGYVKTQPDMSVAVDDSYCQYAIKQLGPYK